MRQKERLVLISAIDGMISSVHHERWPSGICADSCKGCVLENKIRESLDVLKSDLVASTKVDCQGEK